MSVAEQLKIVRLEQAAEIDGEALAALNKQKDGALREAAVLREKLEIANKRGDHFKSSRDILVAKLERVQSELPDCCLEGPTYQDGVQLAWPCPKTSMPQQQWCVVCRIRKALAGEE